MDNLQEILVLSNKFGMSAEQIVMNSTPKALIEYIEYLQNEINNKDDSIEKLIYENSMYEVLNKES